MMHLKTSQQVDGIQIVISVEVIIESFLPEVRKMLPRGQRTKKFKQKSFEQKSCDDFNVGCSMLPTRATFRICACHMMRFGPITCRYSAL